MRAYAASKGVPVYMGYNKNVTPYVQKARDDTPSIPSIYLSYPSHPSAILSVFSMIHGRRSSSSARRLAPARPSST